MIRVLCLVVLVGLLSAGADVRAQERIVSPNANLPYLGVHGTFTLDQTELAARDPRNPNRVVFERMERFSFYEDLLARAPMTLGLYNEPAGAYLPSVLY